MKGRQLLTGVKAAPGILWARKWLLLACLVAAGLAALPIALMGPSVFSSTITVVVPPTIPLPRAQQPGQSTSILAVRMASFAESQLQKHVREAMGAEGKHIDEVTGEQDADLATYSLTAKSTRPKLSREAATKASEVLIAQADEIAGELVDGLIQEVRQELQPVVKRLQDDRQLEDELSATVQRLERKRVSLASQITSAEQGAVRADALDDPEAAAVFRARIEEFEADIAALDDKLAAKEVALAGASSQVALLESRYTSLTQVTQEAEAIRISRLVASAVSSGPTEPDDTDIEEVLLTEGLAVAAGLLAGAAFVLLMEWRHRRKLKRAGHESGETTDASSENTQGAGI